MRQLFFIKFFKKRENLLERNFLLDAEIFYVTFYCKKIFLNEISPSMKNLQWDPCANINESVENINNLPEAKKLQTFTLSKQVKK